MGYITIRFSTTKAGKRVAHYWGKAYRWLPISVAAAEFKLARGEARLYGTAASEEEEYGCEEVGC